MLTDKEHEPGQVLAVLRPFVWCLADSLKKQRCDFCFVASSGHQMLSTTCQRCHKWFYCDQQCQWSDYPVHQFECKVYSRDQTAYSQLTDEARLMLRLYLLVTGDPNSANRPHHTEYFAGQAKCFNDLNSNSWLLKTTRSAMDRFEDCCRRLTHCGISFDRKLMMELFGKMLTNDGQLGHPTANPCRVANESGGCVWLQQPYRWLDHSCVPTAVFRCRGNTIELVALKRLAVGEPITVGYVDLMQSRRVRNSLLRELFGLHCQCLRCWDEDGDDIAYDLYRAVDQFQLTMQNVLYFSLLYCRIRVEVINRIFPYYHPEKTRFILKILEYQLVFLKQLNHTLDNWVLENLMVTHGVDSQEYECYVELKSGLKAQQLFQIIM